MGKSVAEVVAVDLEFHGGEVERLGGSAGGVLGKKK
jgi:hypothetical protein